MRNVLNELPVLLCCIRGGLIAGAACAILRLPGRTYLERIRGRRVGLHIKLLIGFIDALAAGLLTFALALTLYEANGGEPRLYALCGFAAGAVAAAWGVRGVSAAK